MSSTPIANLLSRLDTPLGFSLYWFCSCFVLLLGPWIGYVYTQEVGPGVSVCWRQDLIAWGHTVTVASPNRTLLEALIDPCGHNQMASLGLLSVALVIPVVVVLCTLGQAVLVAIFGSSEPPRQESGS